MRIDIIQLEFIHPILRNEIIPELEKEFGEQVATSLYRIGDLKCHGTLPLRAIDIRCRNEGLGVFIVGWINKRWIYDPMRVRIMVAKYHKGTAWHIHIQVHRNTKKHY